MRIDVSVTHELFWTRLGDPDHSCQQSFNDYILYPAVVWDAVSLMSTADVINIMPFRTGPAAEQMPPHMISEKQSCEREMLPSRGGKKRKHSVELLNPPSCFCQSQQSRWVLA